ncbi:hypothetical protein [Allohahella marinimesophila]|uniref:Uncharacterized protein n=1 Tax=Allohahella marinimesophila TaxID=1054972 RepID=A0ABP7NXK4_9GAMM
MSNNLLSEFLHEDHNSYESSELIAEIEEMNKNDSRDIREFFFNRFNVYLHGEKKEVRLEDELDISTGVVTLSFEQFVQAVSSSK